MGRLKRYSWIIYLICALLLFSPVIFANQVLLFGLDISKDQKNTKSAKIILTLNKATPYKIFMLQNPTRLVIDLKHTLYFSHKNTIDSANTIIKDFRHGIQNGVDLRMVFDLQQSMKISSSTSNYKDFQLVVNLMPELTSSVSEKSIHVDVLAAKNKIVSSNVPEKDKLDNSVIRKSNEINSDLMNNTEKITNNLQKLNTVSLSSANSVSQNSAKKAEMISNNKLQEDIENELNSELTQDSQENSVKEVDAKQGDNFSYKNRQNIQQQRTLDIDKKLVLRPQKTLVVVIDAGHGGKDPGTIGSSQIQEKDITLAIAKNLQELVNKQPGMRAVMTRSDDFYVGLRERLAIARQKKGDIFIAIHADAYRNPEADGASVFALSLHGASSEAARWLAQKENYSEIGKINLNGIDDHDSLLRSVLIDLSQTATISASLHLGEAIIKQLAKITDLHRGFVEQAPFMVLKSPDIPSVLVETGFLSNPKEASRLADSNYQQKIAEALLVGIKLYFQANTPQATALAKQTLSK